MTLYSPVDPPMTHVHYATRYIHATLILPHGAKNCGVGCVSMRAPPGSQTSAEHVIWTSKDMWVMTSGFPDGIQNQNDHAQFKAAKIQGEKL